MELSVEYLIFLLNARIAKLLFSHIQKKKKEKKLVNLFVLAENQWGVEIKEGMAVREE